MKLNGGGIQYSSCEGDCVPVDEGDEEDAEVFVDSISSSLSKLAVDICSMSIKGKSSIVCAGEDARLITDEVSKIFGGESNTIIGSSISGTSDG